jgi:DUF4097 and DUF4098 domain-containing protein YvlB
MRSLFAVAALSLLAAAPLAAQDYDDDWLSECRRDRWNRHDDRVKHCEIREDSLRAPGGNSTITVDPGQNGGVAIRGWDKDSIYIRAKIQTYGRSEAAAAALARQIRIVAAGSTIRTEGPEVENWEHSASWSVSFEVYVPRRSNLDLETENGPLSVREVVGTMDLEAHNGPVALRGVGGMVRARVQNGPLVVSLTGARWEGEGLDAETVNGPVTLAVPEGYSAQLETGTVNGPMSVDFPLTVTIQGRISHRINTTLGSGGPRVRVVTTNGPLSIRRR